MKNTIYTLKIAIRIHNCCENLIKNQWNKGRWGGGAEDYKLSWNPDCPPAMTEVQIKYLNKGCCKHGHQKHTRSCATNCPHRILGKALDFSPSFQREFLNYPMAKGYEIVTVCGLHIYTIYIYGICHFINTCSHHVSYNF